MAIPPLTVARHLTAALVTAATRQEPARVDASTLIAARDHLDNLASVLRSLDLRIEWLDEVEARWDVPGGSKRLALRARDKAAGLRIARRLLAASGPIVDDWRES